MNDFDKTYDPKVSIVVPTYNEENDIEDTILSLLSLNYTNVEIIIVDDSIDNTPLIVQKYINNHIRLIRPEVRRGRCEARNIGIREASGEIIIILNADVRLPIDFIDKILNHYKNGADFVLVQSQVENTDKLFARYVESVYRYEMTDSEYVKGMVWTEGFSIKKDVAMKTSLFPTGFVVPIVAGEDARFGFELESLGAKKVMDLSIVVKHIAPHTMGEYWQIRKGRGAGTPQIRRFLDKWSFSRIKQREYLKLLKNILICFTVFPMLFINYRYAKYSEYNTILDTFRFSYAWIIEKAAFSVGAFESLNKIMKKENESNNGSF